MASVFKRGRWVDAAGRECAKGTPGAKWVESRFYTVQIRLPNGRIRRMKGYTDRQASEQLGAKWERAKSQGAEDMIDPYKEHRTRPILAHLKDWIAELKQTARSAIYIGQCENRIIRLAKECNWARLGDISADSFARWRQTAMSNVAHNRKEKTESTTKMGPRTQNHYLLALTTFVGWCIKRKRLAANPVAHIEKVDETDDVRRARRALSEDEVSALLEKVPEEYRILYQTILATGLRRGELAELTWGDVKLNAPTPFIQLRAETTKSGRPDILPLRSDLAQKLRDARGEADDDDKVFRRVPRIKEHKRWLKAAGIEYTDGAGRHADLHALRHTFGTMLSKSGVSPREAMELMRHTDMRLTMKVYTDPRIFNLAAAVEKLPGISTPESQKTAATGTDGDSLGSVCGTQAPARIGFCEARNGTDDRQGECVKNTVKQGENLQLGGTGWEGEKKRAKGVEPSTFTLAT